VQEVKVRMPTDGGFPVNTSLAGIVPMATHEEQELLVKSIKDNGQKEPIVLWKGEIVDGRCRQAALLLLGFPILYRELEDTLTKEEVSVYVKAVNTRRNLTTTQKVMVAAKSSLENKGVTVAGVAEEWGVSKRIVENARYLYRNYSKIAQDLFDGKSVAIQSAQDVAMVSNKITAVYAFLRRKEEEAIGVVEDSTYGWVEGSRITSHLAKEWY